MSMSVLQMSEYTIRRATEQGKPITNLKLQKTLYYLQGYSLRVFDAVAFPEELRHWQYGPVAPMAYFAYSTNGAMPLEQDEEASVSKPDPEEAKLYNSVIDACLDHTARDLVSKTHEETPWKSTAQDDVISQNAITKYFCANDPLELQTV